MRYILVTALLALSGYGYWEWHEGRLDPLKLVQQTLDGGQFPTLEIRYSASQIMEAHRLELIKDLKHKYLEAELKFYPYLLLWDLVDGEMVLDTADWQKTHGFGDCIKVTTDKNEFRLLRVLAKRGGTGDREDLVKSLNIESDLLDTWIDSCRRKKLIVAAGNKYRLHLEKPLLDALPETRLDEKLVTKSFKGASRLPRRYSVSQVQRMCKAAFGGDFVIKKTSAIFLPVHGIVVQNPDGSVHTSHWNALNGKRLFQSYYLE
jgi:hypothetical protein